MREAVGGSILFYIILGFLAVYIVFIGVIMNYAATYRASNSVLTKIEQTEATTYVGTSGDSKTDNTLYGMLRAQNYHNRLDVCCADLVTDGNVASIYKIRTYVNFEFPLLGVNLDLVIKNDTKTIYGISCSDSKQYGYNNC